MLANALIAGVISGIGYGFQNSVHHVFHLALRRGRTTDPSQAFEAGLSAGVGRAMDRLAQYYISLAEKTFPMIEVDAGRSVDVVLTEGVVIDAPLDRSAPPRDRRGDGSRRHERQRYDQVANDAED